MRKTRLLKIIISWIDKKIINRAGGGNGGGGGGDATQCATRGRVIRERQLDDCSMSYPFVSPIYFIAFYVSSQHVSLPVYLPPT